MLHLYDRATMARALTLALPGGLHRLLTERVESLREDLIDLTEYLVVESGDSEDEIVRAVGFSPLVEPIDGFRFGEQGFQPVWDYLVDHGGWFELIVTFGSSFACVLIIEDEVGLPPGLRAMCRFYT